MAGAGFEYRLEGGEEALDALALAVERTQDTFGLYDRIGVALVASTQKRFEDEAGPDGNPWPQSIRAMVSGGRTLTHTARMVGSITHNPSDRAVEVGTNAIQAAIHQFGGTIRPVSAGALRFQIPGGGFATVQEVTMPARPFLGLDAGDEAEIIQIAGEWIGLEGGDDAGR